MELPPFLLGANFRPFHTPLRRKNSSVSSYQSFTNMEMLHHSHWISYALFIVLISTSTLTPTPTPPASRKLQRQRRWHLQPTGLSLPWIISSLEKGKSTHSSILAWRIPWTIQYSPWVAKSWTWLSDFHTSLWNGLHLHFSVTTHFHIPVWKYDYKSMIYKFQPSFQKCLAS